MSIIDRWIVRSFVLPFVLTLVVAVVVLIFQFLWKYVDELVGKGIPLTELLRLFLLAGGSVVPLAVPVASLVSAAVVFGEMSEHFEVLALRAVGVSHLRMMVPVCVVGAVVGGALLAYSQYVLPRLNLEFYALLYTIRRTNPGLIVPEDLFYEVGEEWTLLVRKKREGGTLEDIYVYEHGSMRGIAGLLWARRGTLKTDVSQRYVILSLEEGVYYMDVMREHMPEAFLPMLVVEFDRWEKVVDMGEFGVGRIEREWLRTHHEMLSITELVSIADSFGRELRAWGGKNRSRISEFFRPLFVDSLMAETAKLSQENIRAMDREVALYLAHSVYNIIRFLNVGREAVETLFLQYKVALHRRFTFAVSCVVLVVLGAVVGIVLKKGGLGAPVVTAGLIFIGYFMLSVAGERMVREGMLEPWVGMWLANGVFGVCGVVGVIAITFELVRTPANWLMWWRAIVLRR